MHPNAQLINDFYSAFSALDHARMAQSYSDEARFSDPVFRDLDAGEVRAMWRMFCTGDNEIDVSFTGVEADDSTGRAHWEAVYSFPKTGRRVHNKIDASFDFADGRIVRHSDKFDFYRWTRMALGPVGTLMGWTPIVQNQVRSQARAQLKRFQSGQKS